MKNFYFFFLFNLCALGIKAQTADPLFIFDSFYNAKIHFKNRSLTVVPMNYDAVNDKMYFKQNDELMELTNQVSIDSIVWSGKRNFVPSADNGFLEKVKLTNGDAYIRWRIRNVNVGSRGALGSVTQGKVESISVRSMGVFSATDPTSHSADVFQQKNNNEYFILKDGALKEITTLKQAQKLYPGHETEIKEFAKRENINMKEPLSVLKLLDFCLGLSM